VTAAARRRAEADVSHWAESLEGVEGIPFRRSDRLNLLRAALVTAALSSVPHAHGVPLEDLLADCSRSDAPGHPERSIGKALFG
jgi:hypothetical protein